jgi:enamine deaminase RidA (YjgF/YER057c/UK114 family)
MAPIIDRLNPTGLHQPPGYHHVTVVAGGRTAYLAGQCPIDAAGDVVGEGDLAAQIDQVVANCMAALGSVNATPEAVVRSVIYVVSADADELGAVWWRLRESALAAAFSTASTLLGVAQLGYPGQLVEVDLTAVVD